MKSDNTFDSAEYELYSPLYLSITLVVTYILAFMFTAAVVVHTALHLGPRALRLLRGSPQGEEDLDIHARLMKRYAAIPSWCYWLVYASGVILAVIATKASPLSKL